MPCAALAPNLPPLHHQRSLSKCSATVLPAVRWSCKYSRAREEERCSSTADTEAMGGGSVTAMPLVTCQRRTRRRGGGATYPRGRPALECMLGWVGLGWTAPARCGPALARISASYGPFLRGPARPGSQIAAIGRRTSAHAVCLRLLHPELRSQIRRASEHGDDAMSRALLAHVLHRPPLLAYARAELCPIPNLIACLLLIVLLFLPLRFAARGVALAPEDCSLLASTLSAVSIAAQWKRLPGRPRRRLLLRRGSMSYASLHAWCSA